MKTEAVGSCETWFTVCLALRGVAEDLRIIVCIYFYECYKDLTLR